MIIFSSLCISTTLSEMEPTQVLLLVLYGPSKIAVRNNRLLYREKCLMDKVPSVLDSYTLPSPLLQLKQTIPKAIVHCLVSYPPPSPLGTEQNELRALDSPIQVPNTVNAHPRICLISCQAPTRY